MLGKGISTTKNKAKGLIRKGVYRTYVSLGSVFEPVIRTV
jgi:hypothetical protein